MFEWISSLALVIFEVICCVMFFESFCKEQENWKKWHKYALIGIQTAEFFACGMFLSQWIIIKQIVGVLMIVINMCVYFGISIPKSGILSVLYTSLVWGADYLVYAGNSIMFSRAGEVQSGYALKGNLLVICAKLILFVFVILIRRRFQNKSSDILNDAEWVKFLAFPIFTILTVSGMIAVSSGVKNQMQERVMYLIAFGMVVMNIFVYYLISDIMEHEAKLHEKEILEMQEKNQVELYHSMLEHYEQQKRRSHEFKNHILCKETLAREKQYDELVKYLNQISEQIVDGDRQIDTNHIIVNAILNAKYNEAIKKNILFILRVNDLSKLQIQNDDLVVLLANLLNNAIEACESCKEKRQIKFRFTREKDGTTILSVRNTYSRPLVFQQDELKTSKKDQPEEHGVGVKNIIKVVEKYNGSYVIQHDAGEFYISIIL